MQAHITRVIGCIVVDCVCAGVLALLECLRHLSAPDCHGATLLLQSMGAAAQQQRTSPGHMGNTSLLRSLLGLLQERHIAALQVRALFCAPPCSRRSCSAACTVGLVGLRTCMWTATG
jgi:hypothetical protein